MKTMIAVLMAVLGGFPAFAQEGGPSPSRPAEAGGVWKPYAFDGLGVKLLFQDCADPKAHYELSVKDNRLEMHRPADDTTFGSHTLLVMFSKPADAINENFVDKIETANKRDRSLARRDCRPRTFVGFAAKGNKQLMIIKPTREYKRILARRADDGPDDSACGEYGEGEAWAYFEYHQDEIRTRYAFVVYGQDAPLFDEHSIEFFEPVPAKK